MPLAVAVLGASGRMGRLVQQAIAEADDLALAAAIGRQELGPGCFDGAAVVVDFSLPAALRAAIPHLRGTPLVTGTTGLSPADQAALSDYARTAAVLQAANFSPGITVLLDLVARAAAALPGANLEIIEAHHRHKRDAPSGTALALGRAAAAARDQELSAVARHGRQGDTGARPDGEIGFHAIRAGAIVGDHSVWLATDQERIELRHTATSRAVFAQGALQAARWIATRGPGQYSLRQMLFEGA